MPDGMIQTDPGNIDAYIQNQNIMNQLGGSSADLEKKAALDKQMQMANYMREGANMPKGTHIPGFMGGVYVAPSALQSLAAGTQYAYGGIKGAQAAKEEQQMAAREASNRTAIMNMINEQNMRPPMYSPDLSGIQNPLENYNFGVPAGGGAAAPQSANLQPRQAPPRQMTPDEFAALQY